MYVRLSLEEVFKKFRFLFGFSLPFDFFFICFSFLPFRIPFTIVPSILFVKHLAHRYNVFDETSSVSPGFVIMTMPFSSR